MANEVTIKISARDASGPGFTSVVKRARAVGAAVNSALSRAAQDVERAYQKAAQSADRAQRRAATEIVVRVRDDTDRGFRAIADNMQNLGTQAGQTVTETMGRTIPGGISSAISAAGPVVTTAAVALAVAAAAAMSTVIAATIASAVLLGVGGGAIGLGIKAALENPKVKDAWSKLADKAKDAFKDFGKPFEGPMIRASKTFGDLIERLSPSFSRIGDALAPVIDLLAPAVADMAEKMMPGLEKAAKASVPLFEMLAEHMPAVGEALSYFFEKMAENAPAATRVLEEILTYLTDGIIMFGDFIGWLSRWYLKLDTWLLDAQDSFWSWYDGVAAAMGRVRGAVGGAVDWIVGRWRRAKTLVSGALSGISRRASSVWSSIRRGAGRMVSTIQGLPGRIRRAASGMWDGIKDAFRAALNWVIDRWNRLSFRVPTVSAFGMQFGGQTFNAPSVRRFAHGGIAGGLVEVGERGRELVQLPHGSRVIPNGTTEAMLGGAGGGTVDVRLSVDPGANSRLVGAVLEMLRYEIRSKGGGSVQRYLGQPGVA